MRDKQNTFLSRLSFLLPSLLLVVVMQACTATESPGDLPDGSSADTGTEPDADASLVQDAGDDGTTNNGADTTVPVITLVGSTPITLVAGSPYIDEGATAWDDVDGDISRAIITHNPVDPNLSGTYTVTYDVRDFAGNEAVPVSRIVQVVATVSDGIIAPTALDIWNDVHIPFSEIVNPAVPEGLVSYYDMYEAPILKDYPSMDVEFTDPWYVVAREAAVTQNGCGLGIGTSVNTAVEIGTIRNWWLLADGTWYLAFEDKQNEGYNFPNPDDAFPGDLGCPTIDANLRQPNSSYEVRKGLSANGFRLSIPAYAYWDHGWGTTSIKNIQDTVGQPVVAQLTQVFSRLVKYDVQGVDDRDLAKFVINVGADKRYGPPDWGVYGDVGYSVTKRITNDWQATHMLTGGHFSSFADFVASNPPVNVIP